MKALVTGGSGFIGSHLIEALKERGHDTVNYDKKNITSWDILDYITLRTTIDRSRPDVIFHLAGVLGTTELMDRVITSEKVNVLGTLNVLELCRLREIPLVFASKLNPEDWVNPYTITKRACDEYCRMYEEQWGVKVCIIKSLNVYGPRQSYVPVQKYVPIFISRALKNQPLPVWGTGKQHVDPVYVKDVAEAMVRAWENKCWGETIEVGMGKGIPVLDVAKLIVKLAKSESKIERWPMRPGEPLTGKHRIYADTKKMQELLNMHPKDMTSLEKGLLMTIAWWRDMNID